MSEARVKAGIWVQAALRLGAADGRPGMVIHRGDADAGGVLVLLRGRMGIVALSQTRDGAGQPAWLRATGPDPVDEARADEYVGKQRRFDPDLWVIEFEAPDYLPPFEAKLL
ncbi:MAG: DUF1491 family protein [Acidiphilium sp.]|uniref:DUF1491 family protein n=1 Tax=Acidiphilium acidophilum TaxID=76588 RepID=UPI002A0B216E|nr:DUF1491 family protein [Acidiphilium sp.]MEE3503180.1 DUF1491 family protein [Acidiphilium acidophilum]